MDQLVPWTISYRKQDTTRPLVASALLINHRRPVQVQTATFRDVAVRKTCVNVRNAVLRMAAKYRPEWEKTDAMLTR